MKEIKHIVENMTSVLSDGGYPQAFLAEYDQMECLASGGGRETFLVRKKDTGQYAVAKCYDRAACPPTLDFQTLKSLDCPGVPRFYQQYQNEGMICLVREYIPGETLAERMDKKQLSLREILEIGRQLCDILDRLHSRKPPVIHRDIKPENVVIQLDGAVALIDFDISRVYKQDEERDTVFFGTRGYAAPEQYGFGQTDSRADIYAFGVLLRWMATGSIRENTNVKLNAGLQRVIDRCTAFAPQERFRDIREVKRALSRVNRPRLRLEVLLPLAVCALALLGAGFALGRFTAWFSPPAHIAFQEPLVETAVRLQAGKPSGRLTPEDLAAVKNIFIYGDQAYGDLDEWVRQKVDDHVPGPLRTLADLALLPNLEMVEIARQGNVDISGLADHPLLHTVELKHMTVSDIVPLSTLGRLRYAVLFDTGLRDVTALENCPLLETLDVGLNPLADLKRVGYHSNVRNLGFMWMSLPNVDDIAEHLPRLKTISLQHSQLADPSGLASLPWLERVYVLAEEADAIRDTLRDTKAEIVIEEK